MCYFTIQLKLGDKSGYGSALIDAEAGLNNVCIRLATLRQRTTVEGEIPHVYLPRWLPKGKNLEPTEGQGASPGCVCVCVNGIKQR